MNVIIFKIATSLPGFLLGIVCHEAAHAWMANRHGDPTAKMMGRMTLDPTGHYDLFGTIIFPLVGAIMGWSMFGWAKPVPVDTRRFKNVKSGIFWVSFAGPLANLILMVIAAFLYAILVTKVSSTFSLHQIFSEMLVNMIQINVLLAMFNLIPIPPLDGSKMVSSMLNYENARRFEELQRYSFMFFFLFLFTPILSWILSPALLAANILVNVFVSVLS